VVVTPAELIEMVRDLIPEEATIEEADLAAVVSLLKAPRAVWPLENSDRVLLQPERLSHYASALIRTVRRRDDCRSPIKLDDALENKYRSAETAAAVRKMQQQAEEKLDTDGRITIMTFGP